MSLSNKMFYSKFKTDKGFTLIELMTSISIFVIVMTISMGSILGIFDANRKSKSLKTVISNLNLTIESMSKEMRYGDHYHCGSDGVITDTQNCPDGDTFMSFLSSDDVQISYRLNGTTIEKQIADADFVAVTGPDVSIDQMTFYTLGAGSDNSLQPKVVLMLKGHAGSAKGESNFTLQTLVSQRFLDTVEIAYATPPYDYPTPITYYDLTVTKAGVGTGTVTGPSINCGSGSGCTTSYADGSSATLTVSPDSGSSFSGWSGDCSGTGDCNLTINSDKAVTATFGTGCASGSQTFSYTGGAQVFTVPTGCTSFTVKMWGAGGGGTLGAGGGGGFAQGTITSTAGTQYVIYVGGGGAAAGAGGYNGGGNGGSPYGGGGGGKSSLYTTLGVWLMHAGGGGGGGTASAGGAGGGTNGVAAPSSATNGSYCCSYGGGGGTSSSGGAGGTSSSGNTGSSGGQNNGGQSNGGPSWYGGGGGGGYYGGGGGAGGQGSVNDSTGGGGGAGYVVGSASGAVLTAGSGTTPGNSGDANRAGAGVGGTGGAGTSGLVYISW